MNNSDRKPPAASLSVVLPTCGRLVRLRACLEALLASPDPILAEIVVVADGLRTDQRQELENLLARYADSGVRCIEGPGRGPGFARNAGVAASRGALIAFLDDDCLPAPGWLTRLAAIFGEAEAPDVVGGPVLPVFERPALAAALQPHYEHRILQARDQTFPSSVFQPFGIPITAAGFSVDPVKIGSIVFNTPEKFYYIAIPFALVMTFFAKNMMRSKPGRAFIAIRDNDKAAEGMGIDIFRYKLLAFAICTFYAGVAGSLLVHYMMWAQLESFTLQDSIWYLVIRS